MTISSVLWHTYTHTYIHYNRMHTHTHTHTHMRVRTHMHAQFEKGWLVSNSGTKKWKHVKLVHLDGWKPVCGKLDVAEIKPGECVELVARFPPISQGHPEIIKRWV